MRAVSTKKDFLIQLYNMKIIFKIVFLGAVAFAGYKAYQFIRIRRSIKKKLGG